MARSLVRRLVPVFVSVAALVLVLGFVDLDAFVGLAERVRWARLPPLIAVVLTIILAFGWRWRTLMRETLTLKRSLLVTTVALAGNQVLPLRGGDALRVVLSARGPGAPSVHAGVSAMALEKVFDLLAVAALGLVSTSALLRVRGEAGGGFDVIVVAVVILGCAALLLFAARLGWLNSLLRAAARFVRLRPRTYRHFFRPLHYLRQTASPARLVWLMVQTGVMWLGLYVVAYQLVGDAIGVPIGVSDAMVLLFAAALGIAVPAAPSGLGTYHAAVVSAFLLLGRSAAEGLVFAVAAHGVFFVGTLAAGALALPWTSGRLSALLRAR